MITPTTLLAVAILLFSTTPQRTGGSISGIVVSGDEAAQPIRRAIVSLRGGDIATNLSTVTDDQGRFAFVNLDAGRNTVSASKAAYLPNVYGATRPGRPGTLVAVTAGQKVEIRVSLARGAAITGTVRDASGQPINGVQVTVARAGRMNTPSGYRPSSEVILTDDRGTYRVYGLAPGEYVVSALPRVSGTGEIFKATAAELDALFRSLQQPGGAGLRGSGSSGQSPTNTAGPPPGGSSMDVYGFSPTFYGGTTAAVDAARIAVAAGEERSGIDITLMPVRAARIEGMIVTTDVAVTRIRPSLTAIGPPQPTLPVPSLSGPRADGSFTFAGVTPGRYLLVVRTGPGAMMSYAGGGGGTTDNPDVPSLFAMQELSVTGEDITGIALTLRSAVAISGQVRFDATTLTPPERFGAMFVGLSAAPDASSITPIVEGTPITSAATPPRARVQVDGSFRVVGVMPGAYHMTSSVPGAMGPNGWWLRSVMVNGRDVLDHSLDVDVNTTDLTGAVVTFSDRHSELAGTLTTAAGQPATEFVVVVFSADRSHWRPNARRVKAVRPANDGLFSVVDLPAGDYLVAALTDVEPDEWQQPAFLERIVPGAIKITVAEGQKVRQDLRIAR